MTVDQTLHIITTLARLEGFLSAVHSDMDLRDIVESNYVLQDELIDVYDAQMDVIAELEEDACYAHDTGLSDDMDDCPDNCDLCNF